MASENKKNSNCTMIMIWVIMGVIVAAVICCIIGFFCPVFKYADESNLVITFLGALAAFVVISNYAQMVEMRNQMNKRIMELENKLENMNDKVDGLEKTIEIDKDRIQTKFEGAEKTMFVEQGPFYRYYVICQRGKFKMIEIRGKDAFELSFEKYLSRYDDESVKDMFRRTLRDFGVPDNLLDKD